MNDRQLLRYSRHLLLDEFGIEAQQKFLDAHALIVGAGGLGSPAAMYLAAAGVGTITVADGDTVDLTNLQRQLLHGTDSIGIAKVVSARKTMQRLNPDIRIEIVPHRIEKGLAGELVAAADVVLDCSDNFATRHTLNRACVAQRKPLVSGAAVRFDGQISTFDLRLGEAPCYHCLFPEGEDADEANCATMGVFAPLTGIIGSIQAAEALKCIAGLPTLNGKLLLLDARTMDWHSIALSRDLACAVCATS